MVAGVGMDTLYRDGIRIVSVSFFVNGPSIKGNSIDLFSPHH